jgi:uncharacterized protein
MADITENVTTVEALRTLYALPRERALRKQLDALDVHCRHFIALSPFAVLATHGPSGATDASPRGGDPGFVKTPDAHTLLIPDAPGNNRLDSLENLIATPEAGLLFMIPGVDETLRVNGRAVLSTAAADLDACTNERRRPKLVIRVHVREAYLHCAKAFMRSRLWQPDHHVAPNVLPTLGEMLRDQTGIDGPVETQEEMKRRYAADL